MKFNGETITYTQANASEMDKKLPNLDSLSISSVASSSGVAGLDGIDVALVHGKRNEYVETDDWLETRGDKKDFTHGNVAIVCQGNTQEQIDKNYTRLVGEDTWKTNKGDTIQHYVGELSEVHKADRHLDEPESVFEKMNNKLGWGIARADTWILTYNLIANISTTWFKWNADFRLVDSCFKGAVCEHTGPHSIAHVSSQPSDLWPRTGRKPQGSWGYLHHAVVFYYGLQHANSADLEEWFGFFDAVFTESPEDKGLLLASRVDLDATLDRIVREMREQGSGNIQGMSSWQRVEEQSTKRRTRYVLRPLALTGTIQGLILQQRFPAEDAAAYSSALSALLNTFEQSLSALKREAFVQIAETGRAGSQAIRELGAMVDDYGLGIHSEAEPPRTWNRDDFEWVTLNDQLPPLFLEIMRASALRPGAIEAVHACFLGTGAYAEISTNSTFNFYAEATALFKPRITNRTARMFPYHAPILRRRAVELAPPEVLQQWLCGAKLYLREAVEEDGVLLLYKGEIAPILPRAG